jgi:hypothetical protein
MHCNIVHMYNLLDVRPCGRNQDKPVSLHCLAPTIESLITVYFTS